MTALESTERIPQRAECLECSWMGDYGDICFMQRNIHEQFNGHLVVIREASQPSCIKCGRGVTLHGESPQNVPYCEVCTEERANEL